MSSLKQVDMTTNRQIHSINKPIFFGVVGLIGASFSCVILLVAALFLSSTIEYAKTDSEQTANLIGQASLTLLKADNYNALQKQLTSLNKVDSINYVHIYTSDTITGKTSFFCSYNRSTDFPAIPDKIDQINQLEVARYENGLIEFIVPIVENNIRYGYVYIQMNDKKISAAKSQVFFVILIFIISLLLISLFVSKRIKHLLTTPLEVMTADIQHIAQKKDYHYRCRELPYQELDIVAKNINIMLMRTEKHISKQQDAEQEILKLNQELEDKVSSRTKALKESNQELLSTLDKLHKFQNQLVESEKMASLGDMVAGVAHEVNTPIGLGVTASTLLSDRLDEIKGAFEQKTLKSSQLKKFLNDGEENIQIICRNLDRAAELISSFKKVAVDQSSEADREINLEHFIQDVFLTLAPETKGKCLLELNCADNIDVITKPGPLNQIIVNLVMNSLIHGFEHTNEGKITLSISQVGQQLLMQYQDNGCGIADDIQDKIFEPFTTTKRGEGGSGLGLHLVYNLVTQALGGTIALVNKNESGVSFEINFPITSTRLD